jgi:glyoxylase-like metal-dependent hydrolase (beta-lactamase superfamily II)
VDEPRLDHADLEIAVIESMPFAENTYVINRAGQVDCLIFDPGLEPERIIQYVRQRSLKPAAIINTHGHADHIAGNEAMKHTWPEVPLVIGRGDADKLTDAMLNLSAAFGPAILSPPADALLDEGTAYSAAGIDFDIYEIPGHSSGHIVLVVRDLTPPLVIGGDVLFAGSIGRVDFPGGSFEDLRDGIHEKLFVMPDETVVLAGHGPPTTIGVEKQGNPFVGAPAGYTIP